MISGDREILMEVGEPNSSARSARQLAPTQAWKAITDAPLTGFCLAREPHTLFAWDESRQLYLFDYLGYVVHKERAPAPVLSARISNDGSLIALLLEGPRLVLLDSSLSLVIDRAAPAGATTLDTDSHGRFVAVATRQGENVFYDCYGKNAGRFETRQPLSYLRFVPSLPLLIGAAGFGILVGFRLSEGKSLGSLRADPLWEERLMTNLGGLEMTGDASMVLTSCFNLGIQRYSAEGKNEGSYHLGGTVIHAIPDFPGRNIAIATQEGQLAILNRDGNVRWRTELSSAPQGVAIDPLGRYLVYGLATGEVIQLNLEPKSRGKTTETQIKKTAPVGSNLRYPAWSNCLVKNLEEAEVSVLSVSALPELVATLSKNNRFRVFDSEGRESGDGTELRGIGRILRCSQGWIAAATDRQVVLYESDTGKFHRPDLDLVQLTHLQIRPDSYGIAVVQERDRIGRATISGRWVWRKELKHPLEELAIGPHGLTAYTTEDGQFQILDAAGEESGLNPFRAEEPLLMVEAHGINSGPQSIVFVSLSRHAQVLRGHGADGKVRWEAPTPWVGWQLTRVGTHIAVVSPDGKVLIFNDEGYLLEQGGPVDFPFTLIAGQNNSILRIHKREKQLLCSQLSGTTLWRAVSDSPIGPMAGDAWGVAVYQGHDLCCYQHKTAAG